MLPSNKNMSPESTNVNRAIHNSHITSLPFIICFCQLPRFRFICGYWEDEGFVYFDLTMMVETVKTYTSMDNSSNYLIKCVI